MKWLSISFVFLLGAGSAFAQDLDQLRTRAEDHWKKRMSDRKAAAEYVEKAGRDRFIELYEPLILKATMDSFRFTDNRKEVVVVFKTRMKLAIGELDKTVSEKWVWSNNWYLYLGPPTEVPFVDKVSNVSAPRFEVLDSELDLGKHVQGERIPFSVGFRAKRSEFANILVRGIPGIAIKGVEWENVDGGRINAVIDTSLIWSDISQLLTFELVSKSTEQISKSVKVAAQIEGRIRIKQTPEVIDPSVSSNIELEITNISSAPITLPSVVSYNPAFVLTELPLSPEIKPQASGKILIRHEAQQMPNEAAVILNFANQLFPQPFAYPLNVKMPQEETGIDPTRVEEYLRQRGIQPGAPQ